MPYQCWLQRGNDLHLLYPLRWLVSIMVTFCVLFPLLRLSELTNYLPSILNGKRHSIIKSKVIKEKLPNSQSLWLDESIMYIISITVNQYSQIWACKLLSYCTATVHSVHFSHHHCSSYIFLSLLAGSLYVTVPVSWHQSTNCALLH